MKTPAQKIMIILIIAVCFMPFKVNAQNNIAENNKNNYSTNSTNCTEHKKEYQLTYEEFINHYGIDDTCVAIIDIYFDKRENSAAGRMSILPTAALVTLINAPIGVSLMVISSPIAVTGAITRIKYNRKKLVTTLVNYQTNDILTHNLKEKVVDYIENKEEYNQEEVKEQQLAQIN